MNFSETLRGYAGFSFSDNLPEKFPGHVLSGGRVFTARHPRVGLIVQQEFINSHYDIRYHFFDIRRPFLLRGLQSAVKMMSLLSVRNTIDYRIDGVGNLRLRQGQFALLHTGETSATIHFAKPNGYQFIEISWSEDWISTVQPKFGFLQPISGKKPSRLKGLFLNPGPRPAGSKALGLANTMLANDYEPDISKLFFQSEAHTYMMLLLMESLKQDLPVTRLRPEQREKLSEIAQRVRDGVGEHFSLVKLSREMGINRTTLKKAFREMFGETLTQMHMSARMEEGRRLLEIGELSSKQVSALLGYKTTTSFIRKFKEHFGFSPSDINRKG